MPFQQNLTTYKELSEMDDHDHYVSITQVLMDVYYMHLVRMRKTFQGYWIKIISVTL